MKVKAYILLMIPVLLASCGGRNLSKGKAREVLLKVPGVELKKDQVYIEDVSEGPGDYAIVEATIKAALKYQRVGDEWMLKELRLGSQNWEDVGLILEAIKAAKIERTRQEMREVAEGLERYRRQFNRYPQAESYEKLLDLLSPNYIKRVIAFDAWSKPLVYCRLSDDAYRLISSGPDGKLGTNDDIIVTNSVGGN